MNAKGDLIARLLSLGLGMPIFETHSSGPDHERLFKAHVLVDGRVLGVAEGRSKKDAERAAAERALLTLEQPVERPPASTTEPWPIYPPVLAQSIEAAIEFADEDASLAEVRRAAVQFYQELLQDLGHAQVLDYSLD